jgi:cell division protein FtsI/penicillin-binding protein 2
MSTRVLLLSAAFIACGARTSTPHVAQNVAREPASLQRIVASELDHAVLEWHATAAVAIVLDMTTGAVMTTVGRTADRDDPTVASRPIVTGSTLKPIVVAAALDEGTVNAESRFDCAPRAYGSNVLHDAAEHGSLSVAEILAVSSNVGAARVYDTIGWPKLARSLHRFHLDDAPAAIPPITDGASFEAGVLAAGELARITPLQMASAYAVMFDDGIYRSPTRAPERVLRSETAKQVTAMLEAALTSKLGHGKLALVDGLRVAGKTGTADLGGDHQWASFIGTVLNREPRLVVLVGLEATNEEALGPAASAPTFARIVRRMFPN